MAMPTVADWDVWQEMQLLQFIILKMRLTLIILNIVLAQAMKAL